MFPVVNTNTVSSVLNNLYTAYKNQTVSVTQSGTTCVVTLSAASGNANAEQGFTDVNQYLISNDSYINPSTSYSVQSVNIVGNNINITINGTWAGTTARVIYPVLRGSISNSTLGNVKSKTLTFNQQDNFLTSSQATQAFLQLSKSDIFRVVKIYMATSFVGAWNATVQNTAIDVTSRYTLDNGQRDTYYDIGTLSLMSGFPAPTGSIAVFYDYFEHGTGDFFARSSYNPVQVPYESIPQYNRQNLGNFLDYRSRIDTSTGLIVAAAPPKYSTFFNADISYYLGRKEMIFLDRAGSFYHVAGASDTNPVLPKVTANNNAINLYNLTLSPYTKSE